MPFYLYVKTHRVTGLKYLGKTTKDPHKYRGSGLYWESHLQKHGNNVDTIILHECDTNEEIAKFGEEYSNKWNIVESNEWANLKPETGDGGFPFTREGDSEKRRIDSLRKSWENEDRKHTHRKAMKEWANRPDVYEKKLKQLENLRTDPEIKKKHQAAIKKAQNNPEFRKTRQGKNAWNFDHTIYTFVNDGLIEKCTRYELVSKYGLEDSHLGQVVHGKRKTHKGWKLV